MRYIITSVLITSVLFSTLTLANSELDYEKALTAYNSAKYDEAFIHLKNSLQKDPDNLAAKILMGQILLINGYLSAAEAEFYEALSQGADINLVAEPLGNALLFQNKYNKVLEFSEADKLTGTNKVKWLQVRASACVRLNQYDCAIKAYKESLTLSPNHLLSLNGLAAVAIFQEDYSQAEKHLAKALAVSQDDATTWRLKGQLAQLTGNSDAAIDYLQRSLSIKNDDPVTLRRLADLYLASNDFDSARTFVDEIIAKTPNDPLAILLSSWLESKDKDKLVSNERLNMLNDIMANLSPEAIASQPVLLYISGLTAFFHGNAEQAASRFSEYLVKNPDDMQAVMLLARTFLLTQQDKQALVLLEKHEDKLVENLDSALLLGELYIKQNRAFKAEKLVEALDELYENDGRLELFKIKLLAARGNQQKAIELLNKSFEANKNNSVYVFTYSMLNLQAGNYKEAQNGAESLIATYPNEAEFYNLKAGILIRQKRFDEAAKAIEKALSINESLFAAKYNLATIYSRQGKIAESNAIIEELLVISPKHQQSLLLKAHNLVQEDQLAEALPIFNDILVLNPKFNYARSQLASLLEKNGKYKEALYHLERLLAEDFDNPDYLLLKTEVLIKYRNIEEARKTLSIVQHFTQDSAENLIRQSNLQRAIGEQDNAITSLEKAEALVPNNSFVTLDKIKLYLEKGETKIAKTELKRIATKNQDNPNYWLVSAMYELTQSNTERAITQLKKALTLNPNFHLPLVQLYNLTLQGSETGFEQTVEDILKITPGNLFARNILAQYFFISQEFDRAKRLYLQILDTDKALNEAEILNRLAIMSMDEDLDKAKMYSEKALAEDESSASILDTYGWVLSQQGLYEEGLGYLRKAFARESNNPEIRYHIAYSLQKLGRLKEARKELEAIVDINRPFYNRPKAKALLETL